MKDWDPLDYDAWYRTPLGEASDRLEKDLVFSMAGVKAGDKALDAGCGTGIYTTLLAQRGALATGTDNSEAMLSAARAKALREGLKIKFITADAAGLPFPDGHFDIVISVGMLCFIKEGDKALTEMHRVLKPGGRLVVGLLNRWSPWALLRRIKGLFMETVYNEAVFSSPPEAAAALAEAGFDVREARTCIFFLPVNCRMYLRVAAPFERLDSIIMPRMGAFLAVSAIKN
ncbi:MAG: class I SAM-dependent methyltransferase [Deltaproteobacteria bacterium]|nr:class I SAM-dependent methyltransferase [Deltaproteobacteria bacterium]